MEPVNILILAAGLGTRMKSDKAKVLHKIGSQAIITRQLKIISQLKPDNIFIVVGYQADKVEEIARTTVDPSIAKKLKFVRQNEQRGTGHAVLCAQDVLKQTKGSLLVINGDVPLVKAETLKNLIAIHNKSHSAATVISILLDDPAAYGRVVRNAKGNFVKIVEKKDCTSEELKVNEINTGLYCFDVQTLVSALNKLEPKNAQNEYYLTDVPQIMMSEGHPAGIMLHENAKELDGFNSRAELAILAKRLRTETLERLMLNDGVTIVDPDSTYIEDSVSIGRDTTIHPQVIIDGNSTIGTNCEIHSWSHLTNVDIGNECKILNSCVIVDTKLTSRNSVGPFAHLRMHAELDDQAVIGNFVEVKKSRLGRKTKSMHLTYLGDATIGDRVNIGAATVTCNYDGKNKHQTIIEDDVKIGSDTMLVAPIRIGKGSVTGAGSVITKDVPENSLVVGMPARVVKKL